MRESMLPKRSLKATRARMGGRAWGIRRSGGEGGGGRTSFGRFFEEAEGSAGAEEEEALSRVSTPVGRECSGRAGSDRAPPRARTPAWILAAARARLRADERELRARQRCASVARVARSWAARGAPGLPTLAGYVQRPLDRRGLAAPRPGARRGPLAGLDPQPGGDADRALLAAPRERELGPAGGVDRRRGRAATDLQSVAARPGERAGRGARAAAGSRADRSVPRRGLGRDLPRAGRDVHLAGRTHRPPVRDAPPGQRVHGPRASPAPLG